MALSKHYIISKSSELGFVYYRPTDDYWREDIGWTANPYQAEWFASQEEAEKFLGQTSSHSYDDVQDYKFDDDEIYQIQEILELK